MQRNRLHPGIDRDGGGLPRRRHGTSGWKSWYDGTPGAPWWEFDTRTPGGVLFISRSRQSIWFVGGMFVPRKVTVPEPVPEEWRVPPAFRRTSVGLSCTYVSPGSPLWPRRSKVAVPDAHGLLSVNGNPTP